MNRSSIINHLASTIQATSYLEIGVRRAQDNFDQIKIKHKVGVDPGLEGHNEATYKLTSDDFFSRNQENFDIIFIDGLHESGQVERDINNSINCLNNNGYIVCHDMNPIVEERQLCLHDPRRLKYVEIQKKQNNPEYGFWHGDVWKAWVKLRSMKSNLKMHVVNTDFGCGVISFGEQTLLTTTPEDLNYSNLEKNRQLWLNLISVGEFLNLYPNVNNEN